MTNEYINQQLAYPGVYQNENETIPYSPRKGFGFMQPNTTGDRMIELESMKNMSIDQIVELYKDGYRIETSQTPTIETATTGISVSSDVLALIGVGIIGYIIIKR